MNGTSRQWTTMVTGYGIWWGMRFVMPPSLLLPAATCPPRLPCLRPTVSCWPKCAQELPNKFFCYLIVTKLFPHALATPLFRLRFGYWSAAFQQGASSRDAILTISHGTGERGQRGRLSIFIAFSLQNFAPNERFSTL